AEQRRSRDPRARCSLAIQAPWHQRLGSPLAVRLILRMAPGPRQKARGAVTLWRGRRTPTRWPAGPRGGAPPARRRDPGLPRRGGGGGGVGAVEVAAEMRGVVAPPAAAFGGRRSVVR